MLSFHTDHDAAEHQPERRQGTSPHIIGPMQSNAADQALGRLLSREERLSDLIAFLAAQDAEPLRALLRLPSGVIRVRREAKLPGTSGRADLLITVDDATIALLEIKEAAAEHGTQFANYDSWARCQLKPVACFVASLDDEVLETPGGWVQLTLPALVGAWRRSSDPHVQWLADQVASVLEQWMSEVNHSPIGAASSRVVGYLITRAAARLLNQHTVDGLQLRPKVVAERDGGGNAALVAWLPYPGGLPGCYLCIGTRSTGKDPRANWRLRLGVQVFLSTGTTTEARGVAQARILAHRLAMAVLPSLRLSALQTELNEHHRAQLAQALSAPHDGLNGQPDPAQIEQWLTKVHNVASGKAPTHPVFFHDRGLRLATNFNLDVTSLTLADLVDLIAISLDHLTQAATTAPLKDEPI